MRRISGRAEGCVGRPVCTWSRRLLRSRTLPGSAPAPQSGGKTARENIRENLGAHT